MEAKSPYLFWNGRRWLLQQAGETKAFRTEAEALETMQRLEAQQDDGEYLPAECS